MGFVASLGKGELERFVTFRPHCDHIARIAETNGFHFAQVVRRIGHICLPFGRRTSMRLPVAKKWTVNLEPAHLPVALR